MSAKSVIEDSESEQVVDDISNEASNVDMNVLAKLKAKNQSKQQENNMSAKIVAKKERSLRLGILGSGQAGSRIAESFYNLGYDAVVCNTAIQDLKSINVPDSNKLLLEYGVGGASKDLSIGRAACELHYDAIVELVNNKLGDSQVNVLTTSLGGGSGAGSCEVLVDLLANTGKPLVVITVLPMDTEDAQTKENALQTLAQLANLTKSKKISNLLVVDNAKIEAIYHNVSQMEFYGAANQAIVSPIDAFNTFSSQSSSVKALDPMEFSKIFIDGEGLSVYGEMVVKNYTDETAIAESIIQNLDNNLLSAGFNLKQSKYVGFIVAANKKVWDKIPAASVNYALAMINDICGTPKGVFKGIYVTEDPADEVKVYSMFSGLGLPATRVDQLKKETQDLQLKVKEREEERNLNLNLDTGTSETISAAQRIKNQIAAKNSTFGKFVGGGVTDRRK